MGELNEGYTSHRGIRMALSALKMFAPYSGDAASAPGGRGNGAANRIAIWQDGNTLTSLSGITANLSTGVVGITASGSALEVGANASGTSTANIIGAFRKDQNGNTTLSISNQDTGSGANAKLILASSLGNLDFLSSSTAGGAITQINSGSAFTGGLEINQLGANPIKLKTNGTTAITVSSAQVVYASTSLEVGDSASGLTGANIIGAFRKDQSGVTSLKVMNGSVNAAAVCRLQVSSSADDFNINAGSSGAGAGSVTLDLSSGSGFTDGIRIVQAGVAPISFLTNGTARAKIPGAGGLVVGNSAIATNTTDGFLYVPSCAGTPTGTPTSQTGTTPIVYDSTNSKIYFYNGSWKSLTPA